MNPRRRAVRWAVVLALSVFALRGFARWCVWNTRSISETWDLRHESAVEARARTEGDYARAIDRIRREIPADSEYLLVRGDINEGTHLFVLFDLAPRRAILLGDLGKRLEKPERCPAWVVVTHGPTEAPTLVTTGAFFAGQG